MLRPALFLLVLAIWIAPALTYAQDEIPTEPDENYRTVVAMALTGEPEAIAILGHAFESGWWGITPDYSVAARWYRLASEQGHASFQQKLAAAYGLGRGVLQDFTQFYKWVALAASRTSGEEFDRVSEARNSMADLLSSSQLATAKQLAKDWKPLTFEGAKEVIIALPPLDANCGDAWVEMVALLIEVKCLPSSPRLKSDSS